MQTPPSRPEPVVLDTNVVLDWRLFEDPGVSALRHALDSGRVHWLATAAMVNELIHVLQRPLPSRWDPIRERILIESPWKMATVVEPSPAQAHGLYCTDPDDQKFLDLAVGQGVRWLLTRDRALLALRRPAQRLGLAILQPRHWVAED